MSQINFAQLLRAGEGLTQWRPMLLGFLTLVAAAVLMVVGVAAGGAMRGGFGAALAGLCVLLAGVLMAAGMSGVGILLMDKAKGVEPRALMDALVAGLWCLPKLLGFAVVIVLAMNLVGSLLISALVIFPALSAMRLFQNFRSVTVCSAVLSVSCAALGILISILAGTPVGSTIVAVDILAFLICSALGRARGGETG